MGKVIPRFQTRPRMKKNEQETEQLLKQRVIFTFFFIRKIHCGSVTEIRSNTLRFRLYMLWISSQFMDMYQPQGIHLLISNGRLINDVTYFFPRYRFHILKQKKRLQLTYNGMQIPGRMEGNCTLKSALLPAMCL